MKKNWFFIAAMSIVFVSCQREEDNNNEEENNATPELTIPTTYESSNYDANTTAEASVIDELSALTSGANSAESALISDAGHSISTSDLPYGSTLKAVTVPSYKTLVDIWIEEVVKSVNDDDAFQNPGSGKPAVGEEGGLLGSRLLDENGLELEQMLDKGNYGAALYNHALTVINGDLSNSSAIDKLVEIFGTDPSFSADDADKAAKYAKRRSDNENQTGYFYDVKNACLKAKAAIEAGSAYSADRDKALEDYLIAWEKSNFATVINYCNGTRVMLAEAASLSGVEKDEKLGNALHAYGEGVGFAHGFKGVSDKIITDAQIDEILTLFLAVEGETPESYRFLNEASLIANLNEIEDKIKAIYGFTDAEATSFYTNN